MRSALWRARHSTSDRMIWRSGDRVIRLVLKPRSGEGPFRFDWIMGKSDHRIIGSSAWACLQIARSPDHPILVEFLVDIGHRRWKPFNYHLSLTTGRPYAHRPCLQNECRDFRGRGQSRLPCRAGLLLLAAVSARLLKRPRPVY